MIHYYMSDGRQVSAKKLARLSEEEQLDVMEFWFRERYQDPANCLPYESAEGGYIWITGGPYDAKEVLGEEFGESVRQDPIDSLVRKLESECVDWASKPDPGDLTT